MDKQYQTGGYAYITALIAEAVKDGSRRATVTGNHIIDEAIRIPSDFTLILEDCHLLQAEGSFSNIFVNEHHNTPEGKTLAGTDRNISILGRGTAILDGGVYNGLSEKTSGKNGMPPVWKNNQILFTNVDGFKIQNLTLCNNRWWCVNLIFCRNGYVGDLTFQSNPIAIDENGNEYRGFVRAKKDQVLVKNADGVDLRRGCHDIVIENLRGFIEDDSVALTGLHGGMEARFAVEGLPDDICNIQIKNVSTSAFCSNIRILNQSNRDGCITKIHDVLIDGVYDTSENSPYMERGGYGVRIGDKNDIWGGRHATEEETYNITIKNVRSRAFYALHLAGGIGNLTIKNVVPFDGAGYMEDFRDLQGRNTGRVYTK